MEWFKVNPKLMNDPKIGMLSDADFMRELRLAFAGEKSIFSAYIIPCEARLPWKVWKKIRAFVIERDGGICQYCGAEAAKPDVDHVLPLSRGGSNREDNLVTACPTCNRSKNAKTVAEWRSA
jgi:hypothetical protein